MKKIATLLAVAAVLAACATPQTTKSGLDPKNFESEYNGAPTALYTLTNDAGMEVCITNFGGRIVSVMVPDKNGDFKDVVLGFDNVQDYFPQNHLSDFGAAIGRYANRINQGKFSLDGVEYQLSRNSSGHCLHGGFTGWQYQVYSVDEFDDYHVKMTVTSPDGDNGFPGCVKASVTYTLTAENAIDIAYEAETDAPTVVNMTNHSYFNLAGDPANHSVCDDILAINASQFTPVDPTLIPTGELVPVEGTPLDFRRGCVIGQRIDADFDQIKYANGIDHNWVLDTACDIEQPALVVYCPESGIVLTEYTDEPGMQVYTGNFLDGTAVGKGGVTYGFRTAICVESQKYPDTPNKPDFPSATLRPGEKYNSHTIFKFDSMKPDAEACGHDCGNCAGCEN